MVAEDQHSKNPKLRLGISASGRYPQWMYRDPNYLYNIA